MKKMFVFLALAGVAGFIACSKGPSGYCNELTDVSCEKIVACSDGGSPYKTKSDCVNALKAIQADAGESCDTQTEADFCADGGVDYSKMDKCLADLRALTCSASTTPTSCTGSFCK